MAVWKVGCDLIREGGTVRVASVPGVNLHMS